MAKKADDGFTKRVLSGLVTAVEDRNWKDVEIAVAALAKDHGVPLPAALEAKFARAIADQKA